MNTNIQCTYAGVQQDNVTVEIVFTQHLSISRKALFILRKMDERLSKEMGFWDSDSWMHRECKDGWYGPRIEEKCTDKAFKELIDTGLIKAVDVEVDCYFKYKVTEQGSKLVVQAIPIDTSDYEYLIPEKKTA